MAMTVVVVVVIMLALIAGYVTQLGYNQRRLVDASSGRKAKVYFLAQAGVVEASARIRNNYTVGLSPAGSFLVDAYDPGPYSIDVDGDSQPDTTIDIGPANITTKMRPIYACGCDQTVPCPPPC